LTAKPGDGRTLLRGAKAAPWDGFVSPRDSLPLLVIGLGNPLMGDEGIGCVVARRLAADPGLPAHAEVLCGGTDLLRYADQIEGRARVVLIDAVDNGDEPGTVTAWRDNFDGLDDRQEHSHHLSVIQAIKLLQAIHPVPFTLLGISIASARAGEGLSAELASRTQSIVERAIQEVSRAAASP